MAERFERLFSLPNNMYSKGSPVIVVASLLLKDTETGKIIVQLKYKSISRLVIKAVKVEILAYDVTGKQIEGVNEYQYLDLNIENGQEFGSNKAIVLSNDVTRSFAIKSISVVVGNGTTISVAIPLGSLPTHKSLNTVLNDNELIKQYQIEVNKQAIVAPIDIDDIWCCSCGEWNSTDSCTKCGALKTRVLSSFNRNTLLERSNKRLAEEKVKRELEEEKQRLAFERTTELARIAKEKKNKLIKKTSIILIPIIIAIASSLIVHKSIIKPTLGYNTAVELMNDGEYETAILEFQKLGDYKDSTTKIIECNISILKKCNIGDCIKFGKYEQDDTYGKEKIEWIVLSKENNKILVISKYALDGQPYNTTDEAFTWETSTLRKWLNNDFITIAFSNVEKKMIASVKVSADKNTRYNTFPGNNTEDKIFLLSATEAKTYFTTDTCRKSEPTKYASWHIEQLNKSNSGCWFWLRTPGDNQNSAVAVGPNGSIFALGFGGHHIHGIRPAMWIDITSLTNIDTE